MTAGQRLEKFRNELGITKKEFSRRTNLDYAHLYRILKGENDPGFETCMKINSAFPELSLTWLIVGEGEMRNITREERNDIQRVRRWREENSLDVGAAMSLLQNEYTYSKSLSSELREKGVYDEKVIERLKGILLNLLMERRELWSVVYEKYKNDYAAEKNPEKLTEEDILEDMHGNPELQQLNGYIAAFCALGGKSQSKEIVNQYFKTRK